MDAKALPANLDAEQAVIGACILDRDAVIAVAPWLLADDFYLERHRFIYAAILACYEQRTPPDRVNVCDILRQRGQEAECGGGAYLVDCTQIIGHALHVEYHARIVVDTALARAIIQAGGQVAALGYEEGIERAALIAKVEDLMRRATQRAQTTALAYAEQVSREFMEWIAADAINAVPTGLTDLDRHLVGGFEHGDFVLLAARPSVGKTALALAIARNVARDGTRVLFVSFEMRRLKLWQRLVALEAGIEITRIRDKRHLGDGELGRIVEADGRLSQLPLVIDDQTEKTFSAIRTRALALQAQTPIGLVVIDYLQLVMPKSTNGKNREQEVAEVSKGAKALAMQLNCPVLGLSQLNRAVENRADRVPVLSDLRESGSLEQDADTVIFIHREDLYNQSGKANNVADLYVAKHRQGALGKIAVRYDPALNRWDDLSYSGDSYGR
jgi:replicative DNA helicase